MNPKIKHKCTGDLPDSECGPAIYYCQEYDALPGKFWAGNGEYESQVAFCPFCGEKSTVPPEISARRK